MNRPEFESLRDLPEKTISGDIRLSRRANMAPTLSAENIVIENGAGAELRLNITINPEVGSKHFNVTLVGVGPICRLDVDGTNHGEAGRSHKHWLQSDRCPDRNLRDGVVSRPDLAGRPSGDVFAEFCRLAKIAHHGTFFAPEEKE